MLPIKLELIVAFGMHGSFPEDAISVSSIDFHLNDAIFSLLLALTDI